MHAQIDGTFGARARFHNGADSNAFLAVEKRLRLKDTGAQTCLSRFHGRLWLNAARHLPPSELRID